LLNSDISVSELDTNMGSVRHDFDPLLPSPFPGTASTARQLELRTS